MRVGSGGRKQVRSPIAAAQAVRGPARMTARHRASGSGVSRVPNTKMPVGAHQRWINKGFREKAW